VALIDEWLREEAAENVAVTLAGHFAAMRADRELIPAPRDLEEPRANVASPSSMFAGVGNLRQLREAL
jgi:hypothetical protein